MQAEITGYLEHLTFDRDRASATVERYGALFDRFVGFARRELQCPSVAALDVDRGLVERFVRTGDREETEPSAASTRNVRLAALRGLFGYLAAAEKIARDPTVGIRPARGKSRSPGYVTEPEFAQLCTVVRANASEHYAARDVAFMIVLFHAGLRISEALSLDFSQIDVPSLRFRDVRRKGGKVEDVAINTAVVEALRQWCLYRPGYRQAADSQAIFLSDRGRRLSRRAFQRSFQRYVLLAGLLGRRLGPHSLRHSCATALAVHDVRLEVIGAHLGHEKLETTRIYVRIAARQKQAAVALLAGEPDSAPMLPFPRNSGLTPPIPNRTLASNSARKGSSAPIRGRRPGNREDTYMGRVRVMVLALLGAAVAAGCGPTLSTQTRIEVVRPPGTGDSITKNGLVVESPLLKDIPSQFIVRGTACGVDGQPMKDAMTNEIVTKEVTVLPKGFEFYQLKITNQTDHVIRLQGAVIRLFDPGENQIEPQGKDDIAAAAMRGFPDLGICSSDLPAVQGALGTLKLIGPNTELLPGTTTSGFLFFQPQNSIVPGVWKLSLYEIPTKVDATGAVVEKTRFDFPHVRKKLEDTFSQDVMGPKKLVSTKEVQ